MNGVETIDIIVFGGQSNMQGQSDALTDASMVTGAMEYKWCSDSTTPLTNPVGEDITTAHTQGSAVTASTNLTTWLSNHIAGSACYGYTNLVPKFCENYIVQTNRNVMAVHVAKGSTKIENWVPGGAGYDILIKKSNAAIDKAIELGFKIGKIYFVWLQGESDALAGNTTEYYKEQLTTLCNALKTQIGIDKFGIIRVGRFAEAIGATDATTKDDAIINAQDQICQENSDFVMLTTSAADMMSVEEYMNPNVAGHYSAKGLEKLGAEAGTALGKMTE